MPLTVAAPSSAMYYHRTPRRPHPRIPPPQPPPPVLHCLCFAVACMLLVQPGSAHPAHRRLPDLTSSTSTKSLPPTPKILSNVNLTCCVLVKYPYVFPIPASSSAIPSSFSVSFPTSNTNNNTDQLYDGWTIRNFRHLASKTGLSCGTSFVLPAATWTEKSIISELSLCRDDYRKCNCTFVIGAFSERGKTHGQVKFLPDNGFDRVVVLTRVENTQNSQSSGIIFGAFDPTVWAAIVMLMGMYTVLKMLDTRFSPAVRASARYCEHDDGQGGRRMEGNSRYNYDRGVNGHGQVERQRSQRLLQECQQQQGQQRQQQQQHEQRQQEEQQAVTAAKSIGRRMKRWRNVVMKSRFFYRLRKSIQSTGTSSPLSQSLYVLLQQLQLQIKHPQY